MWRVGRKSSALLARRRETSISPIDSARHALIALVLRGKSTRL